MSLAELLITIAIAGLLASLGISHGGQSLARQRLLHASRQLQLALERARDQAQASEFPCALELGGQGWQEPVSGDLPVCTSAIGPLLPGLGGAQLRLDHNLRRLTFTSNGLVLGGGTVWLHLHGTEQVRCVVISLPLGITRHGTKQRGRCLPA